jgi:hypothetical protein
MFWGKNRWSFLMQATDLSTSQASNPAAMTRSEILVEIEAMIFHRLFERDRWLPDRETSGTLCSRLEQLGLEERVPPDNEICEVTALGRELHFGLLCAFFGLVEEWEIPMILGEYGLIGDFECDDILHALGAGGDAEIILKECVLKAYFAHYKRTNLLN